MRRSRSKYKTRVAFECRHKDVAKALCEVYTPVSGTKGEYAGFLPNGTDKMELARLCWRCLDTINRNPQDVREAFYEDNN